MAIQFNEDTYVLQTDLNTQEQLKGFWELLYEKVATTMKATEQIQWVTNMSHFAHITPGVAASAFPELNFEAKGLRLVALSPKEDSLNLTSAMLGGLGNTPRAFDSAFADPRFYKTRVKAAYEERWGVESKPTENIDNPLSREEAYWYLFCFSKEVLG